MDIATIVLTDKNGESDVARRSLGRSPLLTRLAPADSWFALSTKLKTDIFAVYVFAGTPQSMEEAVATVLQRARGRDELRLRIVYHHGFPHWVSGDVGDDQVIVHPEGQVGDWADCLRVIGELITNGQLDIREVMWKLHIFPAVSGVPASAGLTTVAVFQISHVIADGLRSSALAGILFGRAEEAVPALAERMSGVIARSVDAFRWRWRLARDTEAGNVPAPPSPVPALGTNAAATGRPLLRTLVMKRSDLPTGYSVTIGTLNAISEALSGHLSARGEDASQLTASVPMAMPTLTDAYNRSFPEFIRLFPEVESMDERAELIAECLEGCRRRRHHPAFATQQRALATWPSPLLRWVNEREHPEAHAIFANTSLSSVYRGPADLDFGGCPVVMTSGYPYVTPTVGLVHGVHGIGDTVAISVHTAESVMPDVDEYLERLEASLRRSRPRRRS